jgi:hypothetical protein
LFFFRDVATYSYSLNFCGGEFDLYLYIVCVLVMHSLMQVVEPNNVSIILYIKFFVKSHISAI